MFNVHTKHKQDQLRQLMSSEHAKLVRHRRRLNCIDEDNPEFQTNALQACQNRVCEFIEKMNKDPIEVGDDHDANWRFLRMFREPQEVDKNISDERFKLRDELDWQSLLTPMERSQRKAEEQTGLRFLSKAGLSRSLLYRDCTSQEPYDDRREHNFRDRHSQKEIHQSPMTFAQNPKKTQRRAVSMQQRPTKVQSVGCIPCRRATNQASKIQKKLQDNISERKSIILSATMKYKPKQKVDSITFKSTGSSFRPKTPPATYETQRIEDPIEADECSSRKKKWEKIYFKDMVQVANLQSHKLNDKAKDALMACNLNRYKNPDF